MKTRNVAENFMGVHARSPVPGFVCTVKEAEAKTPYFSEYDFFGVRTCVKTSTLFDKEHLDFYFAEFVPKEKNEPDITLYFLGTANGKATFEFPLKKEQRPQICFRQNGNFRFWPADDSPLPPFLLSPLCERMLVLHASAVAMNSNSACLFIGENYSGKSTMALEMMRRGHKLITDDLAVFENGSVHVLPKPVGIRNSSMELIPFARKILKNNATQIRQYTSNVTGLIYLVPFALMCGLPFGNKPSFAPRLLIFLDTCKDAQNKPLLIPLTRGQAVVQMSARLCGYKMPQEQALLRLCHIAEKCSCYLLRYDLVPDGFLEAANAVSCLITQIS